MIETERLIRELHKDMRVYFSSVSDSSKQLEKDYLESLSETFGEIAQCLDSLAEDTISRANEEIYQDEPQPYVLEGSSIEPAQDLQRPSSVSNSKSSTSIEKALLVGHVALALSQSQTVSRALKPFGLDDDSILNVFTSALAKVWEKRLKGWKEDALDRASRNLVQTQSERGEFLS